MKGSNSASKMQGRGFKSMARLTEIDTFNDRPTHLSSGSLCTKNFQTSGFHTPTTPSLSLNPFGFMGKTRRSNAVKAKD